MFADMKKFLLIIFISMLGLSGYASTKMHSGSFECLYGESEVAFKFDFSHAKYKKKYPVEEFVLKANRAENWMQRSLGYFINSFNYETARYGLMTDSVAPKANYILEFNVLEVGGSGKLKGVVFLKSINDGQCHAAAGFSSGDQDDDDDVTYRDQMASLGQEYAKLILAETRKPKK